MRLALGALIALLALAAMTATAGATAPTFRGSFDGSATPDGSMTPNGVGVDQATGDVYVIDAAHDVVDKFDADGGYVSQLSGSATTQGSFMFSDGFENDVEVDNSGGSNAGNVYIVSENSSGQTDRVGVFAFRADGSFLWQASFDPGGSADTCGVSVDTSGNPWISDFGAGVQELDPADGSPVGSPVAITGDSCETAFDAHDNLFVRGWGSGAITEFSPPAYSDAGVQIHTAGPDHSAVHVAVDRATGYVYVPARPANQLYVYDSAGNPIDGTPFDSGAAGRFYVAADVGSAAGELYVSDSVNGDVEIFDLPQHTFAADTDGSGTGSVSCDGGTCASSYDEGTQVTLDATPDSGSTLSGWTVTGDPTTTCLGTNSPCTVTMNADVTVTATFDLAPHRLTVAKAGAGAGSITSAPAGISCGATCSASFDSGTSVTLTASAAAGSTFTGWSGGGCSGTGTCAVTLNADTAVTATFAQNAPTAATGAASGIGQTGATLGGTVNPNGASTSCHFEYGTSTSYGSSAPCASAPGSGASGVGVSAVLSGLTAGTTYHYRLVATNGGGTTNGADQTFTTTAVSSPPARTCATDVSLCPKPKLSLSGATGVVRSGKVAVKLSCKGDARTTCTGKLVLTMKVKVKVKHKTKTKTVVVGRANISIAGGSTKTISVKLTHTAKAALAKRSSLKVTLTAPGVKHAYVLKSPAKKKHKHKHRK